MRFSNKTTVSLAILAIVAAIPIACGGNDKPATNPSTGSASAPSGSTPVATASAPAATASATPTASAPPPNPLTTILTTDPAQIAAMLAAAASALPAVIQPASQPGAGDPIEAGIKALAAKQAPGMQPVGGIARGDLTENGQHVSMMITLEPGKCYAIVGFSPKDGVKDLDLRLLAPPFYTFLAGEDLTDDNVPVIGKAPTPMCPVLPVTIAYKVDISSQKGAGKAGVQLYAKTK